MARHREFDEGKALDAAMRVFWTHGYEGASLTALTAAMGISRPSLYAAFGNKEALYAVVLDRYVTGPGEPVTRALAEPTAEGVVAALLDFYAARPKTRPAGCLLVNGALRCSDEGRAAQRATQQYREGARLALEQRFEAARRAGEKLPGAPAELARWVWTILNGMALDAADGASAAELRAVGKRALAGWKNDMERRRGGLIR